MYKKDALIHDCLFSPKKIELVTSSDSIQLKLQKTSISKEKITINLYWTNNLYLPFFFSNNRKTVYMIKIKSLISIVVCKNAPRPDTSIVIKENEYAVQYIVQIKKDIFTTQLRIKK